MPRDGVIARIRTVTHGLPSGWTSSLSGDCWGCCLYEFSGGSALPQPVWVVLGDAALSSAISRIDYMLADARSATTAVLESTIKHIGAK